MENIFFDAYYQIMKDGYYPATVAVPQSSAAPVDKPSAKKGAASKQVPVVEKSSEKKTGAVKQMPVVDSDPVVPAPVVQADPVIPDPIVDPGPTVEAPVVKDDPMPDESDSAKVLIPGEGLKSDGNPVPNIEFDLDSNIELGHDSRGNEITLPAPGDVIAPKVDIGHNSASESLRPFQQGTDVPNLNIDPPRKIDYGHDSAGNEIIPKP